MAHDARGKEREIIQLVVSRFLNLNEPTSRRDLVSKSKSREAINELCRCFLRSSGDTCLPTCLSIDRYADPGGLDFAKQSVRVVLHALQNLYETEPASKTNRDFTFEEVKAHVANGRAGGVQGDSLNCAIFVWSTTILKKLELLGLPLSRAGQGLLLLETSAIQWRSESFRHLADKTLVSKRPAAHIGFVVAQGLG